MNTYKKQIVLSLLLSFAVINISAQDVVVKKDGSTILAKVIEVNPDNIKYKKFSNQDGPTYTINLCDVMAVNYENGDKDTFDVSTAPASESQPSQRLIERKVSSYNKQLIESYNAPISLSTKEQSKKPADKYILIFGVSEKSILSNEDIEITYKKSRGTIPGFEFDRITYNINIKNKTNKTIYIDKANCFRMPSAGMTTSYMSNEQVTVSSTTGGGTSVGLGGIANAIGVGGAVGSIAGGIAVGRGNSNSISSTYSENRILAIPPMGNVNIRDDKAIKVSDSALFKHAKSRLISKAEVLDFSELAMDEIASPVGGFLYIGKDETLRLNLPKGMTEIGNSKTYDENRSPLTINYFITYSTSEDFAQYSTVSFGIYLREIIGCKKYK
ncbi:MAG: hypothetical protein ACI31A_09570, partial [Candidatus Limisoma sp.]